MSGITTRQRLLDAAVESFSEKGFTATTTRDIASLAGMSPAAVYVHHDSKESLLFTVSLQGHESALRVIEEADVGASVVERLRSMVFAFSHWHATNSRVGRIVQYEYHAMTPEHRHEIAGFRRRIERRMQGVLDEGVSTGEFDIEDTPGTARALLSLSIDLVRWFVPGGAQTPGELADLHAKLAVRMVSHKDF